MAPAVIGVNRRGRPTALSEVSVGGPSVDLAKNLHGRCAPRSGYINNSSTSAVATAVSRRFALPSSRRAEGSAHLLTGLRQTRTLPRQLLHLAPDPGDLLTKVVALPEDVESYLEDWEFHQATGMVAVQIGTHDMVEAAFQLIAAARALGESPHDAALLVIDRQLRVG